MMSKLPSSMNTLLFSTPNNAEMEEQRNVSCSTGQSISMNALRDDCTGACVLPTPQPKIISIIILHTCRE